MVLGYVSVKRNEQLVCEYYDERYVLNGPQSCWLKPFTSYERRSAVILENTQFAVLKDEYTGELETLQGPAVHFLTVSQSIFLQRDCYQLSPTQYCRVMNKATGTLRVVRGPTLFVPECSKEVNEKIVDEGIAATQLSKVQYMQVSNKLTGVTRTVRGPCLFFPEDNEYIETKKTANQLSKVEYLHVSNKTTGDQKTVRGPCLYFPDDNEVIMGNGLRSAIALKKNEYVRVVNRMSGEVKVVKGEALLFLDPVDQVVGDIETGINVDACKAVLIRKVKSGQLELITERQVFIPTEDEQIVEEKKLIRLEEYHTAVIKNNETGDKTFRHGPTTFFLQPFTKLLEQRWSTGIHKDRKDLTVALFDSRPHFMWYDFEARTRDNVELVLSITFFWAMCNVQKMVTATSDPPGDLCAHARSVIIQAVSQLDLETFLANFNHVIESSVMRKEDSGEIADKFYEERGLDVHNVEVRSVSCKDKATQAVLQDIIKEHTNRIARMQKQESANEVNVKMLEGQIASEEMRLKLLDIKLEATRKEGRIVGEQEAARIRAFMEGTEGTNDEKMAYFQMLRKTETLKDLSKGAGVKMYFTPSDVNLKIE